MKSWDVYLDSFVNVLLPDDVDPETLEGHAALRDAAIAKYMELMSDPSCMSFNWERYEDGDEEVDS